ncbi:MAG: family 3 adenylate cyclase [Bacteroidetes bacterium]|nr:family 3 adenylate cyclase [Bacteroidota bacterium]
MKLLPLFIVLNRTLKKTASLCAKRYCLKVQLLILISCSSTLSAQQSKVDSLKLLLKADTEDTMRVKHLNLLSWNHKSIGQFKEALASLNQALELGEKANFRRGVADSYNMIGVIHFEQGDIPNALENYLKALEIRNEIGDKRGLASAYNNIALIYHNAGNNGKALENYAAAVKVNKETGNKNWLANNYNNIGNVYADKKDYDKALENYLTAKKIKEDIKQTKDPQYANIIGNVGGIYFEKRDHAQALHFFQRALEIRQEIEDINGIALSHNAMGSVFFERMKLEKDTAKQNLFYAKALESFSAGWKLDKELNRRREKN